MLANENDLLAVKDSVHLDEVNLIKIRDRFHQNFVKLGSFKDFLYVQNFIIVIKTNILNGRKKEKIL